MERYSGDKEQLEGSSIPGLTLIRSKFCAPKGVGALYIRQGTKLLPILHDAGHERGMRP
jgi:cysteine desulfurase